jgi:hypothetical protein
MLAKSLRSLFAPLLAFSLLCSVAAQSAYAQDDDEPDAVAQAKEHYKAGLDAYKAGHYDVAIRELKKAYLLKKLPPLLLNIGATYRKMGDLDLSLHFYQKFLDEAPSDAKDRPEVEGIIAELKSQKKDSGGDDAVVRKEDENPAKVPRHAAGEWNHVVIDAAPPQTPIDVRVSSPVMKGVKVYVYYRGPGQADYSPILMKRHGTEKVGRIPATAVNGSSLQYYIEAKDSAGSVVKSSGSQGNPNIIMIEEGVKPVMLASMSRTDSEEPAAEEETPKARSARNNDDDDEAAPKSGADLKTRPVHKKRAPGEGPSTLRIAGYALLGVGGAMTVAGAILTPLGIHQANNVVADSKNPIDGNGNKIFYNNDPNAGGAGQEKSLYTQGKTMAIAGDVVLGVGIPVLLAGVGCIVADIVANQDDHPKPKKKKKKAAPLPADDEAHNWFIAPSGSPTSVGLAGGFSF